MPLASTLWPISGRSVVVIPAPSLVQSDGDPANSGSGVVAEDEVGHAARLLLALDVIGEPVDRLGALAGRPVDRPHLGDDDVHPDPAAHAERGREADLVEAVVEDDPEPLDRADLPQ